MMRPALKRSAVLALVGFVFGGVITAGLSSWMSDEECFQYDVSVEGYVICGTPEHIANEHRKNGKEMAESAVGFTEDPVALCLRRATAQARMHDWPDRYREAYSEGCKSAKIPKVAIGKDSNITPAWEEKIEAKELAEAVRKYCEAVEGRCTR